MTATITDLMQLAGGMLGTDDPERRKLLVAARDEVIDHGFRRTSVADIARRAQVSRQTVYRHVGDKDQIVRAVVLNELAEFLGSIATEVLALPTAADRATRAFTLGVAAFRTHPLAEAVRRYEPETMLTMVTDLDSPAMELPREAIATVIAAPDPPEDSDRSAAEVLLRITASLLITPTRVLPIDTDENAHRFAATYFPAIISAARTCSDS